MLRRAQPTQPSVSLPEVLRSARDRRRWVLERIRLLGRRPADLVDSVAEMDELDDVIYDVLVGDVDAVIIGLRGARAWRGRLSQCEFVLLRSIGGAEGWDTDLVRSGGDSLDAPVYVGRSAASMAEYDRRILRARTFARMLDDDPLVRTRTEERLRALAVRIAVAETSVEEIYRSELEDVTVCDETRREISALLDL